jgi:O-antigen ligase
MSDYRKFSLLSDPAAFGIFMCSSSLITIILAFRPTKRSYRALLLGASLFMILAMAYSGTRTAYAMFVAGLIMFLFMTINNKRTLIFSAVAIFAVFVLLFGPIYGNATINRIRSTFNSEDASLNVRDRNRATIQEYIYSHPMGGGVMTTGDAGMKYNPNHRLAGFPPDSGYLKIVLETGWTGLFLAVLFFYVCLRQGIKNFYHTQDENIRYYYLAITAMVFSISIGSYAQSVHTQVPIMLFFYPSVALLTRISYSELIPQK